ncbi:hypothetical protein AVEN_161081-1 [Araneus ventricosus]|uniref:Uncharacterized protein n=1 Tax=Araneus ventricosus TaxID=182803 RepID=A0A4Y2X7H8_ARAVE|nr:hypothetical protein AVEN_161081-1 [Araneus ventricosus]
MFVKEATISYLFILEVLGISDPSEMKIQKGKRIPDQAVSCEKPSELLKMEDMKFLPWEGDHLPLPSNKDAAIKCLGTSTPNYHLKILFTAYEDAFK